jgi:DNA-binding NtrC family response regulator
MAAEVLCIIYDDAIALRFTSALERAGHSTARATQLNEALNILRRKRFRALVIGPLVPPDHAETLIETAHGHRIPSLVLFARRPLATRRGDALLDASADPAELVEALQRITGRSDGTVAGRHSG